MDDVCLSHKSSSFTMAYTVVWDKGGVSFEVTCLVEPFLISVFMKPLITVINMNLKLSGCKVNGMTGVGTIQ